MKKFLKLTLLCFLAIFFLEYIYKIAVIGNWFDIGFLYTLLFALAHAFVISTIISLLPQKMNSIFIILIFTIITIIFVGESLFTFIIGSTFSINSLNLIDQAFDFRSIIYETILLKWPIVLLMIIPLTFVIILKNKVLFQESIKIKIKYIILTIIVYLVAITSLLFNRDGLYSPYNLYFSTYAPTITINKLGLLTEFNLDIIRYVTNYNPDVIIDTPENIENNKNPEKVIEYNTLDLDFDRVESSINDYIKNRPVTNKNDYTGIFKGKNIIYILAEGFNSIAVNEEITPTLYKLVNSGLVFTNYYSPMFMSTTGGEYQFVTSLIPTQKSLNTWKTTDVTFSYSIGNAFKDMGYNTYAFHDWTYTYYNRNKTMKTIGFDNYLGCRNGLEKRMNCKIWPPSDIQMISSTVDDYINDEHFAVYYVTVSGHSEYTFDGNNMARKNKKVTDNLPYSLRARAYLSTQIELNNALDILLNRLEEYNKLDDTVIVLSGDHYPYSLTINEINELSSYKRDLTFEVNHSNLILYNSSLQYMEVDTLSSSVDVLPTILNMFGYQYDSRLLFGSDIFSNHESLVIFNDNSWISNLGRYDARTDTFIPNEGVEVDDEYVYLINKEIQNRINAGNEIVSQNYYSKLISHS